MMLINSSQIESYRGFKSGLFGGQKSLSINDRKLLGYIIFVLNDVGMGCTILLKDPLVTKKLHSHILKLQEVRFDVATMINSSFIEDHQELVISLEQTSNDTIIFCGNFCFCMAPPFSSTSARFIAHTRSF